MAALPALETMAQGIVDEDQVPACRSLSFIATRWST
jgi:hypothetical protein